jgi:hypothetical protein
VQLRQRGQPADTAEQRGHGGGGGGVAGCESLQRRPAHGGLQTLLVPADLGQPASILRHTTHNCGALVHRLNLLGNLEQG